MSYLPLATETRPPESQRCNILQRPNSKVHKRVVQQRQPPWTGKKCQTPQGPQCPVHLRDAFSVHRRDPEAMCGKGVPFQISLLLHLGSFIIWKMRSLFNTVTVSNHFQHRIHHHTICKCGIVLRSHSTLPY